MIILGSLESTLSFLLLLIELFC